jgi:hypothetical protein
VSWENDVLATYDGVIRYLLRQGWLTNETIVDGDVAVTNASRRNGNFTVSNGEGPHYFLKQETRDPSGQALASVAYEAAVYELLATVYRDSPLLGHLPRCYGFDPDERVLVLEALVGWTSLADHHRRRGRFSARIAAGLGAALAELHGISAGEKREVEHRIGVPDDPPWVFSLPEPDHWLYVSSSYANIELVRILQGSEDLGRSFHALKARWQNAALMHGDLKWVNCLVPARGSPRSSALKIVDWELARLGDPCWDVGSVLSGYLEAWLSSIPISHADAPDRFLQLARFPLDTMQPALRAFWLAYSERMEIPSSDLAEWLERATSYAGVRLVQSAFEQLQLESRLTATSVFLVQLGANVVARPLEAAVQLVGLPLPRQVHEELAVQ